MTTVMTRPPVPLRSMTPRMDGGPGPRGRIGLLALSSDHVGEHDFERLFPAEKLAVFTARLANADTVTLASLAAMESELAKAARLILPASEIDVFAYSCTSGTVAIGAERVTEILEGVRPGVKVTTPITAAFAAFERLGAHRIAMLTPYIDEINRVMVDHVVGHGVAVTDFIGFGLTTDRDIGRVTPEGVVEAACALDHGGADAIFVSCTGLRAVDAIEAVEAATGRPVVTSNQAMAWHAMRLAGFAEPVAGFGRLLTL